METVAVFKLPASPNIVRAGCREPQIPLLFPDYKLLPKQYPPIDTYKFEFGQYGMPYFMPRAWPPLTWYNFFSNYLWHFNISLFNFFPNIFFDIRYGYVTFRDHTDALNAPDHDELTYNTDGMKMNIAGTTYAKTPWDSDVTWIEIERETGINQLERIGDYFADYEDAKSDYENAPDYYVYTGEAIDVRWASRYSFSELYLIWGQQSYAIYDTTNITNVTSAKFEITVPAGSVYYYNVTEDPILYVYKHDFGDYPPDSADWSGGTLIAQRTFTLADNDTTVEIDLAAGDVTAEGYSKYRFSLSKLVDVDYWPLPITAGTAKHYGISECPTTLMVVGEYIFECDTKDGFLKKSEQSLVDWDTCWNAAVAETPAVVTTGTECHPYFHWWFVEEDPPNQVSKSWGATTRRAYITFDTSSLSGKTLTSATLKIYIKSSLTFIDEFETDSILYVYQQAWDTLDTADWSGGTLVGEIEWVDLVKSEYNEISINTDYINKEGETQLKLAWKADMGGAQPNDPAIYSPAAGETVRVGGGLAAFDSRGGANKPLLVVQAQ